MSITTNDQSYVPAHLAIEAMRDNGYKNTAYAVAELIDNSIQAEAIYVQLLCAEKEEQLATRRTNRINEIAVLDNGLGMDENVLKMALQFGNGTRLGRTNRSGMGRFGMGLPASSISQCKRVDVWSWQNGIENALHIYLDVDEVKNEETSVMPVPTRRSIPARWQQVGQDFGYSGTLVVWSKLDRMLWNKGATLIDNSEQFIGRMYRKFINNGTVKIRSVVFNLDNPNRPSIDKLALPNDPLYLMERSSTPEPFNDQPMFNPFGGENDEVRFTVDYNGELHDIKVRLSYAKEEAREKVNAGGTPFGKHAAKNVGVSVVRAGRELELDQTLVIQYNPKERWWGVEIEFPPALDELFGVTNNKQSARNLSDIFTLVKNELDSMLKEGKTITEIMDELKDEGDPRGPLLEVGNFIQNQLVLIRRELDQQTKGMRTKGKLNNEKIGNGPEKAATEFTEERKELGYKGASDDDEIKTPLEKEVEIKEELVEFGVDEETAEHLAATTVSNNLKYLFAQAALESDAFFTVNPCGGAINILLNTRHPAYENLLEVLENTTDNVNAEDLKERLEKASDGLKLLLMAWARYEDEIPPDGIRKDFAKDARMDWGRIAKRFLKGM